MTHFINKLHTALVEDYMNSYITKKTADCILYSEDGSQFKIHKELFGQTEFMRRILTSMNGHCCSMIEIICPCQKGDLQNLVQFLYDGEIHCDDETDYKVIFNNLSQIFGFPEDMHLRCEKKFLDENPVGSSLCENIEVLSEAFENISNESSVMEQSDGAKNIEDGIVSQSKLAVGKKKCAKNRFVCDDCGYAPRHKSTLERHVNAVHLKLKLFKCNICSYKSSRKSSIKKHVSEVHEKVKPYHCDLCAYKCSQKNNLNAHVLSAHDKLKSFKCSLCSFKCSKKSGLSIHIGHVHKKLKPFKCPDYEMAFSKKNELKIHVKSTHEKLMQACPHCENSFAQNNLEAHILEAHDKNKFKCTFCKASYSEKRELRAHVKAVHM